MLRVEYVIAKYFDFNELKHCALNFELYNHFTSNDIYNNSKQLKKVKDYFNVFI